MDLHVYPLLDGDQDEITPPSVFSYFFLSFNKYLTAELTDL